MPIVLHERPQWDEIVRVADAKHGAREVEVGQVPRDELQAAVLVALLRAVAVQRGCALHHELPRADAPATRGLCAGRVCARDVRYEAGVRGGALRARMVPRPMRAHSCRRNRSRTLGIIMKGAIPTPHITRAPLQCGFDDPKAAGEHRRRVAVAAAVRHRRREHRVLGAEEVVDVLEHERVGIHKDDFLELRHVKDLRRASCEGTRELRTMADSTHRQAEGEGSAQGPHLTCILFICRMFREG